MSKGFYRSFGKRLFDLAVAIPALILFAPILALTSILVRIYLGAPLLFRQERPGRDGRLFKICKFRTMTDARDAAGNLLSDDVRLTRFGKFLRSSSLDELPELWNVITGQMSLVGPRPCTRLDSHAGTMSPPELPAGHKSMVATALAGKNGLNSMSGTWNT